MAQWIEMSTIKPDYMNLIVGTNTEEGENQ